MLRTCYTLRASPHCSEPWPGDILMCLTVVVEEMRKCFEAVSMEVSGTVEMSWSDNITEWTEDAVVPHLYVVAVRGLHDKIIHHQCVSSGVGDHATP